MKFVLISLLMTLTFQVEAAGKFSHKLLSYREFKELSRSDRAAYIEDLRLAAVQSENDQNLASRKAKPARSAWINTLLQQAFAASGDMCIFAGYVSRRDSQHHCAQPEYSTGACGAGKTQCNPLLYGYGTSGNGICTSSRVTPTNDCENQYQKMPNYKAYQVADQVVGKNMQAQFDSQSAELSTYCSSSNAEAQKGLCKKLLAKTSYMKAKLAAAEIRKKSKEEKLADAAKDVPKIADAADAAVAAAVDTPQVADVPASAPAPASAAPAQSVQTASTKPAPVVVTPSAPAAKPAEVVPAVSASSAPVQASKPEVKPETKPVVQKRLSAGGCITNKDDFEGRKSMLPADFQKLDSEPVTYSGNKEGTEWGLPFKAQSTMKLQFSQSGKLKLTTTILTSTKSLITGTYSKFDKYSWVPEDDVKSICPTRNPKVFTIKLEGLDSNGNERIVTITAGNGKVNSSSDGSDMDFSKVSNANYERSRIALLGSTGLPIYINNVKTNLVAK